MIDARISCSVLGWTWRELPIALPQVDQVWPFGDLLRVGFRGGAEYTVGLPTLMLAAALRDAPDLDVGPCPMCDGSKVRPGPCLSADSGFGGIEFGPEVIIRRATVTEANGATTVLDGPCSPEHLPRLPWFNFDIETTIPCWNCVVAGRPTGRLVVHSSDAVIMAAARWTQTADDREEIAEAAEEWDLDESELDMPEVGTWVAGHECARSALARLAASWREHLPVLADWLEDAGLLEEQTVREIGNMVRAGVIGSVADYLGRGADHVQTSDCLVIPRALAGCPALPAWIEAFLGIVECPCCEGSGDFDDDQDPGCLNCGNSGRVDTKENALWPIRSVLRARVREMFESATDGCERCVTTGRLGRSGSREFPVAPGTPYARDCPECDGLGRVERMSDRTSENSIDHRPTPTDTA